MKPRPRMRSWSPDWPPRLLIISAPGEVIKGLSAPTPGQELLHWTHKTWLVDLIKPFSVCLSDQGGSASLGFLGDPASPSPTLFSSLFSWRHHPCWIRRHGRVVQGTWLRAWAPRLPGSIPGTCRPQRQHREKSPALPKSGRTRVAGDKESKGQKGPEAELGSLDFIVLGNHLKI